MQNLPVRVDKSGKPISYSAMDASEVHIRDIRDTALTYMSSPDVFSVVAIALDTNTASVTYDELKSYALTHTDSPQSARRYLRQVTSQAWATMPKRSLSSDDKKLIASLVGKGYSAELDEHGQAVTVQTYINRRIPARDIIWVDLHFDPDHNFYAVGIVYKPNDPTSSLNGQAVATDVAFYKDGKAAVVDLKNLVRCLNTTMGQHLANRLQERMNNPEKAVQRYSLDEVLAIHEKPMEDCLPNISFTLETELMLNDDYECEPRRHEYTGNIVLNDYETEERITVGKYFLVHMSVSYISSMDEKMMASNHYYMDYDGETESLHADIIRNLENIDYPISNVWYLDNLYISPQHRNQGIGRALVRRLIEYLQQIDTEGCLFVFPYPVDDKRNPVEDNAAMDRLRKFFGSIGFEQLSGSDFFYRHFVYALSEDEFGA